ncbi:MAG: type III-A CRISPR-associated RAMP protein Csm5 [Firmicutes bacterium]|nr:type III-A CRISPR-associated RAMP protein Csm5 [Bacillota bacterium]
MYTGYEGEALTPLHIGSGNSIVPMEYCFASDEPKLIRIDMDALFRSPEFRTRADAFAVTALAGRPIAETHPFASRYPLYTLASDSHAIGQLRGQGQNGQVLEAIKERGAWYVPGSSIKGALRTLTYRGNITPRFAADWQRGIREQLPGRKWKAKFAASYAETNVSGNPNRSAFRAVRVGDSSLVDSSSVRLTLVKVVEKTFRGTVWKILPHRSTNDTREATPILVEAIKPGTMFAGNLNLNEDLLGLRQANLVGVELFREWLAKLRAAQLAHIEAEKRFYRDIGEDRLESECRRLVGIVEQLGEDEVILQTGWGTGYTPKTVREAVDDDTFAQVVSDYGMRDGMADDFPRTRRVVLHDGEPSTVMGFVKLRFV